MVSQREGCDARRRLICGARRRRLIGQAGAVDLDALAEAAWEMFVSNMKEVAGGRDPRLASHRLRREARSRCRNEGKACDAVIRRYREDRERRGRSESEVGTGPRPSRPGIHLAGSETITSRWVQLER